MLLAQGLASHLFLAGVLVITVTLLYRTQRRLLQMRRGSGERLPAKRDPAASLSANPALAGQTNPAARWEVELHQVAREYLAQVQTQSAVLEQQLREARALSARLAEQLEQLRQLQSLTPTPGQKQAGSGTSNRETLQPAISNQVLQLAAQGLTARQIAARLKRPQGEVELLLRLHGNRNEPAAQS